MSKKKNGPNRKTALGKKITKNDTQFDTKMSYLWITVDGERGSQLAIEHCFKISTLS
jgi:hypothetical protein